MKIQLSISMLASDRSVSLERCLDSLKPLLMQVPSELIIVFTGTDERVREIASRYTDKIIPFTWCDNFSAARNVGLWAAKGEWFMYIDDDEWFDDITEIRDFFLSGEYRNYGFACYIQRNYVDWEGIHYSDYHAFRMSRMNPGIAFQNTIHEELVPRMNPCKYFDAYVHHYGYVSDCGTISLEKAQRNTPLLEKSIKERPKYIKNYLQIVQEYVIAGEWKKGEEHCRKGRELCQPSNDNDYWRWLQMKLVEILHESGDWQRAKQESLRMLEEEEPCELVRLELYIHLIAIYVEQGAAEEIVRYGRQFEDTLEYMDKNPDLWSRQSYAEMTERKVKVPSRLNHIRMNCISSALKLGDISQAAYFLKLLPWDEEYWMQRYYEIFDQWRQQYKESGEFVELLADFPEESPYTLLQRARLCEISDQSKNVEEKMDCLIRCLEKTESFYLQYQAVEETVKSEMDPSPLAVLLDLDTWQRCAQSLMNCILKDEREKLWRALEGMKQGAAAIHGLWLEKLLREKALIRREYRNCQLFETLTAYIQCILGYYKEQYREEVFCKERYNILPKDCRFAILTDEALKNMEEGKLPEAVRLLRSALQFAPSMTGVVREVTRHMANGTAVPNRSVGEEFQTLAVQMKGALRTLISGGQYEEAMSVISQLSPLLPDDLDLLRMRQNVLQNL